MRQTRPITLIKHTRKLFTKLLTIRLNRILVKTKVLSPQNNSALPHTSTAAPISWLTNIQEDAWRNDKDFWILSQDTSKAYDSVHLELLWKALRRIKCPERFIEILRKLMEARENQVITNLGKTGRYIVEDGLDQGSPLSPTLWRIYYDPLIARIAKEFKGYKMETTIPGGRTLECSMSVLAYMDDSLWIADNLEELQKIVDTASSFYKLTKIKVNPAKSVFATNSKEEGDLIFEGGVMERRDQKEPFRYLGCWFGVLEKQKEVREKIIEEANQAIKRLNRARITEKQYIYITNCVLLTRIAYRTQNVVLSENICER